MSACPRCGVPHTGPCPASDGTVALRRKRTPNAAHPSGAVPPSAPPRDPLDEVVERLRAGPEGVELTHGTVVGEYAIETTVGRGGMGVIYSAVHPVIGKRAAVKVMRAEFADDREAVSRFIQEARAVNAIGHPNIVDIFAFGTLGDGRPYCVMELLEGETLRHRLQREKIVPLPEAVALVAPICGALAAAHAAGIVHRDLKPENILIARTRDGGRTVKLLDFGVAKLLQRTTEHTRAGVVLGTPRYMAPEQCRGQPVDGRADLYSVGVLLYEMLAGKAPFPGRTLDDIEAARARGVPPLGVAVPSAVEALLARLLSAEPAARPASATEVQLDLVGAVGRDGRLGTVETTERTAAAPAPPRPRSFPMLVLVVMAFGAGAYFGLPYLLPRDPPLPVVVEAPEAKAPAAKRPAPAASTLPEGPRQTATLIVRTDQPRASFTLDGNPVGDGSGQLRVDELKPGTYRVRADAPFHRPRSGSVHLRAGETKQLEWPLTRAPRGQR